MPRKSVRAKVEVSRVAFTIATTKLVLQEFEVVLSEIAKRKAAGAKTYPASVQPLVDEGVSAATWVIRERMVMLQAELDRLEGKEG